MKKKHLIGSIIIIIFIILAFLSLDESKLEYMNFTEARKSGKTVQVKGNIIKAFPTAYDSKSNTYQFQMRDILDDTVKIILTGTLPNNFEIAPSIVVKGKFEGDKFIASNVLTKCPSKYDGKDIDLHKGR